MNLQRSASTVNAKFYFFKLLTLQKIIPVSTNFKIDIAPNKVKGKGMFLYSAVSSPLDRSLKCFTLFALPGRPVHSDTNSASLGSILARQQLRATTIHSHFHSHA